jgi:hypothetical protein
MLAVTGGRERTLDQYEALLTASGMELVGVTATSTPYSLLKACLAMGSI